VPFIEWTAQYRVNVAQIDEQHQRLVQMLNDLYDAMVERRSAAGVREAIDRMNAYARDHFSVEEKHMAELGYPDRQQHLTQHARFTRKTQELQERVASGKLVLSLEVIGYLRDWLTNHILHTDKRLGAFLNQHGVQ
jgi:hemerythrin